VNLSDGAAGAALAAHMQSLLSLHSCVGSFADRRRPNGEAGGSDNKRIIMANRISANRRNAKKSTGPKNTISTRFNATKHGLLASGVTELDDAEGYRATLHDLTQEKHPVGALEGFLVESAALDLTRLRRVRRLEAEYITSVLNPPIREPREFAGLSGLDQGTIVDPGLPAMMDCGSVLPLVSIFQRYESACGLRLFRTLHELERLQRMRQGEHLPAPAAVDVSVHAEPHGPDSFGESSNKPVLEGSQAERGDE